MTEKKDKRYRVMHRFWLDIQKEQEDELDEKLHALKAARKFQSAVRDALRLLLDLRAGRTDVLFELFPWVKTDLQQSESPGEKALREQLARIEQQLIQQGNRPMPLPAATGGPKPLGGLKPIAGADQNFDLPTFDDDDLDDLVVVKESKGDGQSSHNFLRAMTALQNT